MNLSTGLHTHAPIQSEMVPFTCIPSVPAKVTLPFTAKSLNSIRSIKKSRAKNGHEDRGYPFPTLVMVQMGWPINVGIISPRFNKRPVDNHQTVVALQADHLSGCETVPSTPTSESSLSITSSKGRKERHWKRRKGHGARVDEPVHRRTPTYKLESRDDHEKGSASESSSQAMMIRGSYFSSGESKDTLFNNLGDVEQLKNLIQVRQRHLLRKSPSTVLNLIEVTERLAIAVENLNSFLSSQYGDVTNTTTSPTENNNL